MRQAGLPQHCLNQWVSFYRDMGKVSAHTIAMLQLKQCAFAGAHDAKLATRMGWMRAAPTTFHGPTVPRYLCDMFEKNPLTRHTQETQIRNQARAALSFTSPKITQGVSHETRLLHGKPLGCA